MPLMPAHVNPRILTKRHFFASIRQEDDVIKKIVVFGAWLAGVMLFGWAFLAIVLPGLDVVAYRNGRFPSGAEEFYMADGFRSGTLVVRDYWHCEFKDGFVREYGSVDYGWGSRSTRLRIEVTHDKGVEPKVVNVMIDGGAATIAKADAIREGQLSIDKGRKRLAAWQASQSDKH